MSQLLNELLQRGLIYQNTDEDGLSKRLNQSPITLYCGFDPTADSLHIGSLLPILTLRRFQLAGHHPIALVGGGTGLIGDPSGKVNERTLNTQEIVSNWSDKLRSQLAHFLDFEHHANPARIVNNYDWLGKIDLIAFLRDIGKNFSLNTMLAKESVNARLEKGISFTEFSYMILQSYDFKQLYEQYQCELQIGGSDQWGNITSGSDLIRRTQDHVTSVYGLTLPLVTKSDGSKFGKTESGTIWLDADKTTPYAFYQFWLNTEDQDAGRFLRYFTFLPISEIEELEEKVRTVPEKREAQKQLASEVTRLVHGKEALERALQITDALFRGQFRKLSSSEIAEGFRDVPSTFIHSKELSLVDLLIAAGTAKSKREAREFIKNGAITINDTRITDTQQNVSDLDPIDDTIFIIRRGKKKYFLAQLQK